MTLPPPARRSVGWDVVLALALGFAAAVYATRAMTLIGPGIMAELAEDSWFESDASRIAWEMSNPGVDHARGAVHPLYSLITTPPVLALQDWLGWPQPRATGAIVIVAAGLWGMALYALLRSLRCRRPDAVLYTLLGLASAGAVFWLPIRDRYVLGSVSIIAPLALIATLAHRTTRTTGRWIVASAGTLAVTVTNWMFGILAAAVLLPVRRALAVTGGAIALVTVCWVAQKWFVPSTPFFVPTTEETHYMFRPTADRMRSVLRVVAVHSMVAPRFDRLHEGGNPLPLSASLLPPAPNQLTMQAVPLGTGGRAGNIATFAWLAALVIGIGTALTRWRDQRIWLVILLGLAGQVALHLVYGEETFLYALHWLPLLVALAAAGTLGPLRPLSLALAGTVLVTAGVNNVAALRRAARLYGPERELALRAKNHRPDEPWPRGEGHVLLARPGTPESAKSWHEPGGSLSPVKGSFGVSLWAEDALGNLIASGERLPLAEVSQRFAWDSGATVPAIMTETAHYRARWELPAAGRWQLTVRPGRAADTRVELVIRSVGPSGGPVRSLAWNGKRLRINDAWSLELSPAPRRVVVGHEGDDRWMTAQSGAAEWAGEDGWGYARLALDPRAATTATLTADSVPPDTTPLPARLAPFAELSLPDPRFAESMRAEVSNLAMSLVRGETRSSDPVNTPIPWQRTGAYIVTALARAGQVPLARSLAVFLAENDFYGGFGAEADAPGLGIWALTEVGTQAGDSAYDRWVWPHVRRKAERIIELLDARQDVRVPVSFPITPWARRHDDPTLVANAARDGLIVGRMDHGRPLLFVNAVSYAGLMRAAALATREGHEDDAARYAARAGRLQAAWKAAFAPPESNNPRAYIAALWPSGVAAEPEARATFQAALDRHWNRLRDSTGRPRAWPLWTYFDVAEAHQWLLLGAPERAWQVLTWFWEHQSSPGLYTWWEGDDEGNTLGWWTYTRGWLAPRTVTPHHWTTAEMLLLQLDMLARLDTDGAEPALVIGDGLPREWLAHPLAVRGLRVAGRTVDWSWVDGRLTATIRGAPLRVRPGAPFPRATRVQVSMR
ncbi:MAG TPA: hypothetical protein VIE46_09100 [Gemmatimonadales bacterium]